MLKNIRDILISLIAGAILSLGIFYAFAPEALGLWMQRVDNARFYNTPMDH